MDKKAESISAGVVVVSAETYRALVEDLLLQRMRADNLQRKNTDLIGEVDKLRNDLDKTTKSIRESDSSILWWMGKCEKAEHERDALLAATDLGKDKSMCLGNLKAPDVSGENRN